MSPRKQHRLASIPYLLAACTLTLGACGPAATSSNGGGPQQDISIQERLPLLERMVSAPSTIKFQGERHVVFNYTVGSTPHTLDYTERVTSDGQGQFAIDPVSIGSPQMTNEQAQVFALLQKAHEGFLYRLRDFNVRDVQLFLQNYTLQEMWGAIQIAGQACTELRITAQQGATGYYLLDVDPVTALVLREREIANDGTLRSTVEFTSIDLQPNLSGFEFHIDKSATALDLATDTVPQIGFTVWVPQTTPTGYTLAASENVDDGVGHHWARLNYTDGANQVTFLHTVLTAVPGSTVPTGMSTVAWVGPLTVKVLHVGQWTIAQCFSGLDEFVACGKVDPSFLESMIKSAVH